MQSLISSLTPKPKQRPRFRIFVLVLLVALLSFGGGYGAAQVRLMPTGLDFQGGGGSGNGAPKIISKDVDFPLFWDVWKTVKERYVKQPVSDVDLFHGSIEGMVAALNDPYSIYLKPTLADEFAKDLQGTFEGIGAEVGIKNNVITVIAPLPDTPAAKAGLRAGDKIITIDDKSTAGMSVDEAVNLIRGQGGTKVKLGVMRNGTKDPLKFEITREKIVVKSVNWQIKKTASGAVIGYIEIRQFNDDTASLFDRAVQELLKESPKGLIIDLRNDPGGYLDAAVSVAGHWTNGTVVIERKYDGSETPVASKGRVELKGTPTMVLVNQGSASGSEILAGALQDYQLATLVGMKTFGKGSVQDYQQLSDGSALKLTVAEWLTPKKRSINKEGIAPDVEVDLTEKDANEDKDPQLAKALELVESGAQPAVKN